MSTQRTNKSFTKRLKIRKNGKLQARKAGINHFNAKERRVKQLEKKRPQEFNITNKEQSRFIPHN